MPDKIDLSAGLVAKAAPDTSASSPTIGKLFTDADGKTDYDRLSQAIIQHESPNPTDRGNRNNNPGNMKDGPFAKAQKGYAGTDGTFARFDNQENGRIAHKAMLKRDLEEKGLGDLSPVAYIQSHYSPDSDPGNGPGQAEEYAQDLLDQAAGRKPTKIDLSAGTAGSKIDLSAGMVPRSEAPAQASDPYPIAEGDKGGIAQTVKTGESFLGMPKAIWHALTNDPQDDEEKQMETLMGRGGLAMHRLIAKPMQKSNEVADAYQKIADEKKAAAGKPKDESLVSELTGGLIRPEGKPAAGREYDPNKSALRNAWNWVFSGNADDNGEHEQHMANVHRIAALAPLAGSAASDMVEHYQQGDPSGAAAQLLTLLAAGKVTDSVMKGAAKQIKKVAPIKTVVAGEPTPVMAGQMKDAAPIAQTVATEPSPEIAEGQQTAAQQGVKNVATDALNKQLDKFIKPQAGAAAADEVAKPGASTSAGDDWYEQWKARRAAEPAPQSQPAAAQPAAEAAQPASEVPVPERRMDPAQRQRVSDMTPEERADALLKSEKTGLPNRRAFDEEHDAAPAKAVAMSDADGLKAVNDKFGYAAGDALLKAKADALKEAGVDAYHFSGDEFGYRGESMPELQSQLDNARNILREKVISVKMADGRVLKFKGADFSYGTGQDLAEAESGLKSNKAQREANGERARGELRGITEVGPQASQGNNGGTPQNTLTSGSSLAKPIAQAKAAGAGAGPEVIPPQRGATAPPPVSGAAPPTINGNVEPTAPITRGTASSFGDAATQVKAAAQGTFKKLDQLSDGEFSTFQNKLKTATKAERRATNIEDMESAQQAQKEAQRGIDGLIEKHADQFQPDELKNAQSSWRDAQVLDKVHGYVEKAFSAPEDVAGASKTISRELKGSQLKTSLNSMLDNIPRADLERVIGKDGVQNLYEIAELTAKPENLEKMQAQVKQLASEGAVGKLVKSPIEARNLVARYLATSPRVSNMMINVLRFGTPAKVYGPLIANEIAKGEAQNQNQDSQ